MIFGATIYGKADDDYNYHSNVNIDVLFNKMEIVDVRIEKHTIYCDFKNVRNVILYDETKVGNMVKEDLEKLLNVDNATIELQKHYLDDSIDFELFIDDDEGRELWYTDEYFIYGGLPFILIAKINKWFKDKGYNITVKEIIKGGKKYELEK